jgi:hypothetical protein
MGVNPLGGQVRDNRTRWSRGRLWQPCGSWDSWSSRESGAAALSGALQAIDVTTRPRSSLTFGPGANGGNLSLPWMPTQGYTPGRGKRRQVVYASRVLVPRKVPGPMNPIGAGVEFGR